MTDLLALLNVPNTRGVREDVRQYILQSPKHLEEAFRIVQTQKHPIPNRIAWSIDACDERRAGYAQKLIPAMIKELERPHHPGVYRSLMRLLERHEIPSKYLGQLIDTSFRMLNDGQMPVAVKCHAMQIIFNYIRQYPELKTELRESILLQMSESSVGFKTRGKRILTALKK